MNNEIKEILDKISEKIIPNEHWNKVRNYITNLQQENERLKEILVWKQEHEKELHTRISKAIEYIKAGKTFDNEDIRKAVDYIQNDLLNILQNGSDSQ